MYNLPQHHIDKLQRLQNASARLITLSRRTAHITPTLKSLHWLPITDRIASQRDANLRKYRTCISTPALAHEQRGILQTIHCGFTLCVAGIYYNSIFNVQSCLEAFYCLRVRFRVYQNLINE